MAMTDEYVIKPLDLARIALGYKRQMLIGAAAGVGLALAAWLAVPTTYHSEITIHISGNYFQHPLLGDLVPQTYEPSELREEREKIIRASLDVKFANEMGDKHKIFRSDPKSSKRASEVEDFLKSIDTLAMSASQVRLRLGAPTVAGSEGLIRDAVTAIRATLYQRRTQTLERLIEVLSTEILQASGDLPAGQGRGSTPSETLKAQLTAQISLLEERLNDLRTTYNESHPTIQRVKTDIARLRARSQGRALEAAALQRSLDEGDFGKAPARPPIGSMSKDDLTKRRHLVNLAYEMEKKDPSMSAYVSVVKEPPPPKASPKRRVFLAAGLILGLLGALIPPIWGEYRRTVRIDSREFASRLGVEVFGSISLP